METVVGKAAQKGAAKPKKPTGAISAVSTSEKDTTQADTTSGARQNSADEYLKLLSAKEHRLEVLEQEKLALTTELDNLRRRSDAQLEVIEALKAGRNVVRMPGNFGKESELNQSAHLIDLPAFDESEFQPIVEVPEISLAKKIGHSIKNGLQFFTSLVSSAVGWLAKKIFALLT